MKKTNDYITEIYIENLRNLGEIKINVTDGVKKNLIITGPNGSGKTTFLNLLLNVINDVYINKGKDKLVYENAIRSQKTKINLLDQVRTGNNDLKLIELNQKLLEFEKILQSFPKSYVNFKSDSESIVKLRNNRFLVAFFNAKRSTQLDTPSGITKIILPKTAFNAQDPNRHFIQYLVNLKAERSFAKDDGDKRVVKAIDIWFAKFEKMLRNIFDAPSLAMTFNRKEYNFNIEIENREPFTLNQLADGHSSFLSIVTGILIRMEAIEEGRFNLPGIVLIDELETHLHVKLQKQILPFLNDFFPNIQFIISTHSPFILSSTENSTIFDLETKTKIENLSGYSYKAIVESYFDTTQYSSIILDKINLYEKLIKQKAPNKRKLLELEEYLEGIPKQLMPALDLKFQQIKLIKLNKSVKEK